MEHNKYSIKVVFSANTSNLIITLKAIIKLNDNCMQIELIRNLIYNNLIEQHLIYA